MRWSVESKRRPEGVENCACNHVQSTGLGEGEEGGAAFFAPGNFVFVIHEQ